MDHAIYGTPLNAKLVQILFEIPEKIYDWQAPVIKQKERSDSNEFTVYPHSRQRTVFFAVRFFLPHSEFGTACGRGCTVPSGILHKSDLFAEQSFHAYGTVSAYRRNARTCTPRI